MAEGSIESKAFFPIKGQRIQVSDGSSQLQPCLCAAVHQAPVQQRRKDFVPNHEEADWTIVAAIVGLALLVDG
eukprot:9498140-Pyramimonas_sp.AAC.1